MQKLHALPVAAIALAAFFIGACAGGSNVGRGRGASEAKTTAARPTSTSAMPVTWFSLPADDLQKATSFYHRAFGWEVEPLTKEPNDLYDYNVVVNSPSDGEYTPSKAGRVNGCIVKRGIGVTTPTVLIEVADLDDTVKKVIAAGGTVVSERVPMTSLNGEFILVKDPDGNLLEVFKSNPR